MGRIDWLSAFRGRVAGSNLQRRAKPRRPLNSKLAAWPQVEVFEPRVLMSIDSPFDESFPTGPQPLDAATGYVDANGSLDAIVLRTDGQLAVALNDGSGMWSSVVTTDLSVPGALGLASERFDGDTFQDVAVQGPDSLVIARGDGLGGFAVSHSWTAPVAGILSPSDGRRVGIAAEMLNSDFAVDLLTVLPGSDQVAVFFGNGNATFDAPLLLASGGDEPIAIAGANVIGDAWPDLIVGHSNGSVTFLEGLGADSFSLRPDLTLSGFGAINDLQITDINSDGEDDIVVVSPHAVSVLANVQDARTVSPIINGRFDQGFTGWSAEVLGHAAGQTPGSVNASSEFLHLTENQSFLTSASQTFVVPANPELLQLDLLSLGLEAPDGGIPDAFEISLLDADGRALVATHSTLATSFFNHNPGDITSLGSGVTFDGRTVTLDISSLAEGTAATLLFDLVGNGPGESSSVVIDNIRITPETAYSETFAIQPLFGSFINATSIAFGDVDGDGALDAVVTDASADQVVVFNGSGTGFVRDEIEVSGLGSQPSAVAIGLLTTDDVEDVIVTLFGSGLAISPLGYGATPVIQEVNQPVGEEGSLVSLAAAFVDPGDVGLHTATIDWGDGFVTSASVSFINGNGTIAAAHTYADNGLYSIELTVEDSSGASDSQLTRALIGNVAPQAFATSIGSAVLGESFIADLAHFTDPGYDNPLAGTTETITATIDWGDGSSSFAASGPPILF